jgi:hypothetical protein
MYDAFVAQREKGIPFTTSHEGEHNDGDVPAAG